ncbi:hypothetical protein G4451_12885 [Fusicatenibacter saccharivorans]|uniref:hypothetical protein n=1 Tax=Fusicatenibacter saccharivorans TaxID=1150298 RepID=UPI00156EAB1A|nr:hypothetical protein [Fusicatenibacter saccharivorans]NSE27450.1 hypothetical protein [Fusicatenibacter saccharivorans]
MKINLTEKERQYLLNMLEEKFYTTENMEELQTITSLKQILQADTESWLSELSAANQTE